MDNIQQLKKIQSWIIIGLIAGVLSLAASIVKNIVVERWAKSRDTVACIPADIEQAYPLVYAQTSAHPIQNDALVKQFVEEYIRMSQNESIVDYHRQSKDGRYVDANLSDSKMRAIEMSAPDTPERGLNMYKLSRSSDTFQTLKKGNYGWIFLIDEIQTHSLGGVTVAVVTGEFQATYDKVKGAEIPDELWGYREITLLLNQGLPTKDTKGNFLNKYGIFVAHSNTRIVSSEERRDRTSRNSDYYMKENNE